jgi:hypothetical protein
VQELRLQSRHHSDRANSINSRHLELQKDFVKMQVTEELNGHRTGKLKCLSSKR